ncbi:hypothetical protein [Enterovibrio norvegicus]|uniref:hypothetical protein n=1 Tax=Enterovibrio norvegicus TaxID=188144 RepID=UPI003552AFF3
MKKTMLVAMCTLSLVACKTTTTADSPYKPTASLEDINNAKQTFEGYKRISVTDDGFIVFRQGLQPKEYWLTSAVRRIGYEISCEELRDYLERGFVANIRLDGQGGIYDFYNTERCDQEAENRP